MYFRILQDIWSPFQNVICGSNPHPENGGHSSIPKVLCLRQNWCPFQALQSLVDYDEDSDEETPTAGEETTEKNKEGGASSDGSVVRSTEGGGVRNTKGGGVNSEGGVVIHAGEEGGVVIHAGEEGGEGNRVNNGGSGSGSGEEDSADGRGRTGGGGASEGGGEDGEEPGAAKRLKLSNNTI